MATILVGTFVLSLVVSLLIALTRWTVAENRVGRLQGLLEDREEYIEWMHPEVPIGDHRLGERAKWPKTSWTPCTGA